MHRHAVGSQDLAYHLKRNRRTKQTVPPSHFLVDQVYVCAQSLCLFLLVLLVLLDVDPSTLGRREQVRVCEAKVGYDLASISGVNYDSQPLCGMKIP